MSPDERASLGRTLTDAAAILAAAGIDTPRFDAELLLAAAAGADRASLYSGGVKLDDAARERLAEMIELRARRMPLAYIVGRREFFSLDIDVAPGVLIPRPETETLVAAALSLMRDRPGPRVLDLGCGSGAIVIALAVNAPQARYVASDLSEDALEIAAHNAARHGVAGRIEFRHADLFAPLDGAGEFGRFDLIVSNPPYIADAELAGLAPEIRDFEPRVALAGGADGLDFYRRLARALNAHLAPGGTAMVEVGAGQARQVAAMFSAAGLTEIETARDLAGVERVVRGVKPTE
ncbi:peptide chain release factor N(5)-glutamine methyltransferase [bacterium]|nr:peptide chain release factor N(5)-glutamine methyltransferase [bacterium]